MSRQTPRSSHAESASRRTFLFAMVEGGGNVPAQMSIARRLAGRGHRVHVLGDPSIAIEAERAGCSFSTYTRAPRHDMRDPSKDLVRDWEASSPMAQLRRIGERLMFGPSEAYARDLLDAIDAVGPDALAIDCLPFGLIVGAEKSGLPAALLFHYPYCAPVEGVTPFGLGLRPARGPLGRLRDRFLVAVLKRMFRFGLEPVNASRRSLGMPALREVFDQFHALQRSLVLTSAAYDFVPPALPYDVRYVGAQLDDPAWVAPYAPPWPDDDTAPLVLVSLGSTFQNQGPTLRRIVEALGQLPVRALVTLGEQSYDDGLAPPTNVVVVGSAPHAAVLPRASAVIAHGGHGTVMKALSHGVPLVCIPFGRDQKDNGARVEVAGAGLSVSPKASSRRIREALRRVLEEAQFRQGARRMQATIARETERDLAIAELEALSARHPRAC
ncbi:MAG: glycosyltransferase family 1 protein [Labilithrix sp.]|nr:glycosyltransferase family 1 protein [Labilithrix sp.]